MALTDVRIIIPTFRAERHLDALLPALQRQAIDPAQILVIDSSSSDLTVRRFLDFGARVEIIPQAEFNHGGTRRYASELVAPAEFLIFITQDAIPTPGAFEKLIAVFENPAVGMTYGRQLPREEARSIERFARLRNYPAECEKVLTDEDRMRLGIKTIFCSNSFAAYRRTALEDVGGFPIDAFFAEDQITAGRMLMQGWGLAYAGNASVVHSHAYSIEQEFKRYFDVGVFHARNSWLLEHYGRAEGEGLRYVKDELRYLMREEPAAILSAIFRTFAKYAGYRVGRLDQLLNWKIKSRLSMSPAYWRARRDDGSRA